MKCLFISFFCLVTFTLSAQDQTPKPITLDQLIPKEKQIEMGLDTLTSAQRLKLEAWLTDFMLRSAQAGAAVAKGGAGTKTSTGTYSGTSSGHWLKEKLDGGKMIRLEDSSIWEISTIDKINTMLWLPIDEITIIESKNPMYPYSLVNSSQKNSAEAKYIGK